MPALDQTESNAILNSQLRATAYTAPTTVYVALGTGGTQNATSFMTEVPTSAQYARQTVTFAAASAASAASNAAVTFTNMPAVTVTNVELHTTATLTTRRLYWGSVASKTTASGDTLTFASGAITATVT
jgi:hypothetical protein